MKILIGADLVPTKTNFHIFSNGNINELIGDELASLFSSVDYKIFNLEVPLVDELNPISKAGPNLVAPTNTIKGIKKLGVDFLCLANNHILDQGKEGLLSTIKILKENEISYAGVGSREQANKPHFFTIDDLRIGIYCCAEHEFSIVDNRDIGANPFDYLNTLDDIVDIRKECDYLIVLYHGGKEHYRYPSPNLQKTCRKIVDKGADLVVCQHSHCVGCEEKYMNKTIVYGQGNFIFDYKNDECWKDSLLILLDIQVNSIKLDYIPIEKNGNSIKKSHNENILKGFYHRSNLIKNEEEVERLYISYCLNNINNYINSIQDPIYNSLVFKVLNKLTKGYLKKKIIKNYINKKRNTLINKIECEAHRELIITALKNIK